MATQRAFWIVFATFCALADVAAWTWLLTMDHGPRWSFLVALALVLLFAPLIAWQYIRHDLLEARGHALQEMAAAGLRPVERVRVRTIIQADGTIIKEEAKGPFNKVRVWEWIDADGDGETDEGELRDDPRPRVISIRTAQSAKVDDPGYATCSRVLAWVYEQEAAGLSWGQVAGHRALLDTDYEYAFAVFKVMGLIAGRTKRVQGTLKYSSLPEALTVLVYKWDEGGGYVANRHVVNENVAMR